MTQVRVPTIMEVVEVVDGKMAKKDGAKNFEFDVISDWATYNSSRDKTNIARNVFVRGSKNVYKKLSGNIANRPGQKRRGVANAAQSPISSEFIWNTSWGATYTLLVADSNLYVVVDDVWYSLLSGLTKTRYVFDKWWDNTEKKDRALFVNGTDDMFSWAGGFATVNAQGSGGSTLTKTGTTTWQQAGFSTTSGQKQFIINGSTTVYTYTGGESTTTLTGITPTLPVIAQDTAVLSAVITHTNKPAADFAADFIKVINNQVYVGSYTSRLCYISKNTDYLDYTVTSPRLPGGAELLTLDATLKGIGVRQGNAYIGVGNSKWAVVSFNDVTVGSTLTQTTKVDIKPVATGQAPYAHEFIDTVGDSLVYLAQDQQVRSFGDFNNLFTPGYPSFSQEIATELMEENFTGGSLSCIGEFVYVCAPATGNVYLYQVRYSVDKGGNVVAERLWHSPFVWNLTSVDDLNGEVIGFSNANPQIYDLWDTNQWYDDSPSDEPLPYQCVLALAYRGEERRQGLWSFDKNFTEGYISEGTPLYLTMNYNYQGSTNSVTVPVNNDQNPAYLFTPNQDTPNPLGNNILGAQTLGDSDVDGTMGFGIPKFKVINSMPLINCFEYQAVYSSDAVNARWEILATGTNAEIETEQIPTFIINKLRP